MTNDQMIRAWAAIAVKVRIALPVRCPPWGIGGIMVLPDRSGADTKLRAVPFPDWKAKRDSIIAWQIAEAFGQRRCLAAIALAADQIDMGLIISRRGRGRADLEQTRIQVSRNRVAKTRVLPL